MHELIKNVVTLEAPSLVPQGTPSLVPQCYAMNPLEMKLNATDATTLFLGGFRIANFHPPLPQLRCQSNVKTIPHLIVVLPSQSTPPATPRCQFTLTSQSLLARHHFFKCCE
jgi:hypothetical protein